MSTRISGVPLTILSTASGVARPFSSICSMRARFLLTAKKGVRLILAIANPVDIVIGAVLANNRGGAVKTYSVAVVVVGRTQARSVSFSILAENLGLRGVD